MRIEKKSLTTFVIGILGVILFLIETFSNYSNSNITSIYLLIISLYLCIQYRKNINLLFIFIIIAYCNYSVVFSSYLKILPNSIFTLYATTFESKYGMAILVLFFSIICIVFSINKIPFEQESLSINPKDKTHREKNSYFLVIIMILALIYIYLFEYNKPEVVGGRGGGTTLYEYSIVIFILALYYGKRYKPLSIIIHILISLFILQELIYGGRITALQLLIVLYLMVYENRFPLIKIIPVCIVGFIFFSVVGSARGSLLQGGFSIGTIMNKISEEAFTLDTSYSAYHTSITFLLLEKYVTKNYRFSCFISFIKTIFAGKFGSSKAMVSTLSRQYFVHYYGGFLPFYFEFYLGIFGVILIALYIAFILKRIGMVSVNSSGLKKTMTVYVIASTFRWYIYSPIQITRGILIMILCYGICEFYFKLFKR